MRIQRRHVYLYGALIATLAAAWWVSRLPENGNEAVELADRPAHPATGMVQKLVMPAPDIRIPPGKSRLDAFAPRDWTPPPPPAKPLPPPPPVTPPLPYRYMGKWSSEEGLSVFLQQGNNPRIVKSGDVLDGTWKVEQVQHQNIIFTYLPLNTSVSLNIGESL
jgi:hypothetical protein